MITSRTHRFLRRQIPVISVLSTFPGLGYILLAWLHQVHQPALVWYACNLLVCAWGLWLYRQYDPVTMGQRGLQRWYLHVCIFYALLLVLWASIFLIYIRHDAYKLHYIAIFTQIGASTVAAALLYPEPRLFRPAVPAMIAILVIYFVALGEWHGYVLAVFAAILGWVLYFGASSSYRLLHTADYQATHDLLTRLHNRQFFLERLQQTLNNLSSAGGCSYLLLIDLDHFKTVNDSLGHDVGDRLLQRIAERLRQPLRSDHDLARLGGDEFILIGPESNDYTACRDQALKLARALLEALKQTYEINGHQIYISASIGVRLFSDQDADSGVLVREADIAMYEAKAGGRDGVFLFNEEMSRRVEQHLRIERFLHFALHNKEIELHYQPQLNAQGVVVGAECLARWNHSELGHVPPDQFIPIAEQTGLIIDLGTHILHTAFHTLREWDSQGIQLEQLTVNISVRQLLHHGFLDAVGRALAQTLDEDLVAKVVFEVTESVVADEIARVVAVMRSLRSLGIRLSMDDFGTGYSSLSYLKQLPINEVKIDRAFINEVDTDADNQAMVVTILNIARFFDLAVVAEGIESAGQFDFLKTHHCDLFQGYYFAEPLPKREFEAYIRANRGTGEEEP